MSVRATLLVCLAVSLGGAARAAELAESTTTFELQATGPGALVLVLRGARALGGRAVSVRVERDGAQVSESTVRFTRARPRACRQAVGRLSFAVPGAAHTFRVVVEAAVVVQVRRAGQVRKAIAAAPEVPLSVPVGEPGHCAEAAPAAAAPAATRTEPHTEDRAAAAALAASQSNDLLMGDAGPAGRAEARREQTRQRAIRVAVYDLELDGVEEKIGRIVTDSLVAEIRKLEQVAVIGMDEIREMLSHEAEKQLMGCEESESCLAEIAGALGADNLLTGKLSLLGDQHVVVLRRIDERRAQVVADFNRRLKAESGQEFLLAVGEAVAALFPEHDLREGQERGVRPEVALRLDPPPLPTWSFYGSAGVAMLLGAAGGVTALMARSAEADYQDYAALDQVLDPVILGEKTRRATGLATTTNALLIATGTTALVSGLLALFTDWYGYGEEEKK